MCLSGIDVDSARKEEERIMLQDARAVLAGGGTLTPHPNTRATALHVAAAKGYIEVLKWAKDSHTHTQTYTRKAALSHHVAPHSLPGCCYNVGWMWTAVTWTAGHPCTLQLTGDRRKCAPCLLITCAIWVPSTTWWAGDERLFLDTSVMEPRSCSDWLFPEYPCRAKHL